LSTVGDKRDTLRFLTAGSVDDGKSTLIGRLLYESNGIYEDQLSSVRRASLDKNLDLDLSLLTDGLMEASSRLISPLPIPKSSNSLCWWARSYGPALGASRPASATTGRVAPRRNGTRIFTAERHAAHAP
jgi:hypothetical protein